MESPWLEKAQAADYLHTAPRRIEQLVREGAVPCSIFDGKELFFIDHLDQFLLARQGGSRTTSSRPLAERLDVRADCSQDEVLKLLDRLQSKDENPNQHGKVVARRLRASLERSQFRSVAGKVAVRLARWCSPKREDARTSFVTPLARELSEQLFGRILPRQD